MGKTFIFMVILSACVMALASNEKGVTKYRLRIKEKGTEFTETIEVDEKNQIEVVKVPRHNNVSRTEVMHDFKKNLTMLRDTDEKICYLMPLDKEVPPPDKLKKFLNMKRQSVSRGRDDRVRSLTITSMNEVSDRSFLSDDMALFCAKYAIYQVKTEQASTQITLSSPEEQADDPEKPFHFSRFRRNTCGQRLKARDIKRCAGGMCKATVVPHCRALNRRGSILYMPRIRCKIETVQCSWFMVCKIITNNNGQRDFDCFDEHFVWNVKCCEYFCLPYVPGGK